MNDHVAEPIRSVLNQAFEQATPRRAFKAPPGECKLCDERKDSFAPPHHASERCESGKRNHCTCDICF